MSQVKPHAYFKINTGRMLHMHERHTSIIVTIYDGIIDHILWLQLWIQYFISHYYDEVIVPSPNIKAN